MVVEWQPNVTWSGGPSGGIGPAGMGGAAFSGDPTSYGDSTNNNQTGTNSQSGDQTKEQEEVIPTLTTEQQKWDWLNKLQGTWEGSGSNPLGAGYTYDENYPPLGVSSPYAMQGMAWDPYSSRWYSTQGTEPATAGDPAAYKDSSGNWVKDKVTAAWQGATKGEAGSQPFAASEWDQGAVQNEETGKWEIFKKPILSGIGKHLFEKDWGAGGLPNLDDPSQLSAVKDIQKEYYQQEFESSQPAAGDISSDWGGGGGGAGGGTGYYGDPRQGNPIEQMANYYTPQANLQQAMVNVHGTPTVFKKRGGIVSLLRLS